MVYFPLLQLSNNLCYTLPVVVRARLSSSQNHMNVWIPFRLDNTAQPFFANGEEDMSRGSSTTGIDCDGDSSIRRIFETCIEEVRTGEKVV